MDRSVKKLLTLPVFTEGFTIRSLGMAQFEELLAVSSSSPDEAVETFAHKSCQLEVDVAMDL